jgi:hypothetical protein
MSKKSLHPLVITICCLLINCRQNSVNEVRGCDCEGQPSAVVDGVAAQISASPQRYFSLKEAVEGAGKMLLLCDTTLIAGLPVSKAGDYDYVVSGKLRPPCISNGFIYVWYIELTSIRKK